MDAQARPAEIFKRMRPHAAKLAVAVLISALAVWAVPRWWLGPEVTVLPVVQRDFVQTVVATGRVETPHRVDLSAQITGTVQRVPVAEGQAVAAGAVLIELESTELRAALSQAELAVRQAQARQRQLREVQLPVAEQGLSQAQANQLAARRALERSRDLFAQGFVGQAAVDEAQRAEQVAAAQWRSAQQQVASARGSGSDAALTDAALAQAQAGADAARARLAYATVRAPVAGTLIARNVEPGDGVQPGKLLMVLSPQTASGETQLVVQIDEKNLRLLRVGLPAVASAEAYAAQRFAAELAYINPGVDAQRGSVEVKLRVAQPPAYLRQDMTVSVDIEVARRSAAVLVPTEALRAADAVSPWVLKIEGGRAVRQPVKLGLRSNGLAEVLEGLRAGDAVVPAAAVPAVAEGARVRAAPKAAP